MTSDGSSGMRAWIATDGLALAGAFFFMLGARWALVDALGVNMPFWDQWGAEGGMLYVPWTQGTFDPSVLLATHGEHRILTTRLLGLALFDANAVWNTRLQMCINALIHAAAITLLCLLLARGMGSRGRTILLLGGAAFVAYPLAWENSLNAFQAQFYLTLLFQVPALYLLLTFAAWTRGWWAALALVALAFLSLSSGMLPLVVAAGFVVLDGVVERRVDPRAATAGALLIALGACAVWITPVISGHDSLRAGSLSDLLLAMSKGLAWPWPGLPPVVLLIQAPWVIVLVRYLKSPDPRDSPARVLAGFGIWLVLQAGIVAYGRGAGGAPPSSRHLDLVALGLLVNLACLLHLHASWTGPRSRAFALLWALAVLSGAATLAPSILEDANERHRAMRTQAATLQAFLTTRDERWILEAEPLTIPVPISLKEPLLRTLRNADYVAILPAWLSEPPLPANPRKSWARPDGRLSSFTEKLLAWSPGLAGLGSGLLAAALLPRRRAPG